MELLHNVNHDYNGYISSEINHDSSIPKVDLVVKINSRFWWAIINGDDYLTRDAIVETPPFDLANTQNKLTKTCLVSCVKQFKIFYAFFDFNNILDLTNEQHPASLF